MVLYFNFLDITFLLSILIFDCAVVRALEMVVPKGTRGRLVRNFYKLSKCRIAEMQGEGVAGGRGPNFDKKQSK